MYTLLRDIKLRAAFIAEGTALALSMLIAELFYKFHSFILECTAFLGTWYVVSFLVFQLRARMPKRRSETIVK
jgi:hypothetical protein